ncbi:restriction endonuclease subunit S [Ancylomarina sp. 16SWW S1-10-2]|uniref:restriction endonuclease subunit S n=1 Tax=Ancylomarina sp. 16SWW S1-10-2 TaxID=2499681 RepID=UPI0012AD3C4E|nr:restriction endonuclease subunit S [Ancylomarina sp. 16SWW S1-10-2]MRT93010.1 restriction endonuclease subunit S [Ancylomarina sp. 16SWW S1-10-2]
MTETKKRIPKRRFKEFTGDWEECKLEDMSEIIGGGTPSTCNNAYWDGHIDWYAPAEIDEQIYASGSKRKITELGLKNSSAKILPPYKTILFTSRAGIGKTAILSQPGATNQGFQSMVLKDEYTPYFIYSMSNQIKEKAEAIASGSTFLEISGKMLGKLEIMVPKKTEQDIIAQFFLNLDTLITLHQRKLDKIKSMKKAYLSEMFPAEGESKPKRRFKGFTDDWEKRKLGELVDIGDIDHRMPPTVGNGIPYLMTGDFCGINELDFSDAKLISEDDYNQLSKKIKPDKGDIIFARYASVGAVRYIDFTRKFLISYSCAIIKSSNKINSKFLFHFLKSNDAQNQIQLEINTGSQANIGIDSMKSNLIVQFPCIKEQQRISSCLDKLDNLLTLHQQKLDKLKNLKKSYLNEMFI